MTEQNASTGDETRALEDLMPIVEQGIAGVVGAQFLRELDLSSLPADLQDALAKNFDPSDPALQQALRAHLISGDASQTTVMIKKLLGSAGAEIDIATLLAGGELNPEQSVIMRDKVDELLRDVRAGKGSTVKAALKDLRKQVYGKGTPIRKGQAPAPIVEQRKEKPDPYALCPCGCGKKVKFCPNKRK